MDTGTLISIFGLDIRFYGLVYALGFLGSYYFFIKNFKHKNINEDQKENMFFIIAITSLICARVIFCIGYYPQYYLTNPIEILKVWQGGMSINGGFIGFFLSIYYLSKKHNIPFFKLTDIFMLPGLLALAFGRLANLFNQELPGVPTNLPIGIVFPQIDELIRHPYPIYAGLKNIIAFQIIFYLYTFKQLKPGMLTLISALLYAVGRFLIDFTREPTTLYFGFPLGQWFSLIIITICLFVLFINRNQLLLLNKQ